MLRKNCCYVWHTADTVVTRHLSRATLLTGDALRLTLDTTQITDTEEDVAIDLNSEVTNETGAGPSTSPAGHSEAIPPSNVVYRTVPICHAGVASPASWSRERPIVVLHDIIRFVLALDEKS